MYKIFLSGIVLACLMVSCSSPLPVRKKLTAREAKKQRLLEKYRLMRVAAFHRAKTKSVLISKPRKSKAVTGVQKIDFTPQKIIRRPKRHYEIVDFQKKQKEIDQNLTYYCIKYESKYSDDSECLHYANQRLIDCEVKAINRPSTNVIRCLKRTLRIR